jgi:hypothetical protein
MELRPVEPETEVDAGQWIRPRLLEWWSLPDHRMPVGATVPTGFEDYVRVFHPPYRTSDEMDRPVRWSELASLAGVSVAADTVTRPRPMRASSPSGMDMVGWTTSAGRVRRASSYRVEARSS